MRAVFDLEGNGLLDHTTINYLTAPYSLKPTFRLWCAVIHDIDTGAVYRFAGMHELRTGFLPMFLKLDTIIGHNIIDYDLLVLKLVFGIDYKIGKQCYLNGRPVEIIDTLVMSKCLNPDRYGGHGIGDWGQRLGLEKIDWRAKAVELGLIEYNSPKGAEFAQYHPEMLEYNARDCEVNVKVYWALLEEAGDWDWSDALELEHRVRDIVTRQSHRGFWFDAKLAQENVRDLDEKMEKIRLLVEPTLPPKPMGKTKLKEYLPPKIQFKKNGELSENIKKWVAKHGGQIDKEDGRYIVGIYDNFLELPLDPDTPVKTHEPSKISDTTHIKGWLVELGWEPSQYKERDLTVDVKKRKLPKDKFEEACKRYAEQTLNSPFCAHRCRELGVKPSKLLDRLLHHDMKRPLKVYTNPTITVGMEKEIDPALLELADKFPHAKLVSEYLTYAHRRNSILGGGVDPDDFDEEDEFAGKGFLAAERIAADGRIPTPADSCGAGTSRFKHKVVVNVPRSTSLYGGRMRALFGVDQEEPVVQMGYDFASLEAMIESHYCWRYDDEEKTYCKSLTMEKPSDVHTKTAKTIELTVSAATGAPFPFSRSAAKPVKYACAYGAQPARVAKTVGCSLEIGKLIHEAYWEAAKPLAKLGEKLKYYWETTGGKKFILGLDGRKIPTRSASALINSLFQSAGVICAKRTMVLHDEKLEAAGLAVDFFRDNWREKKYAQQLIAMHDEAQMELHRSLVSWKMFKTEDEARAFKAENMGWSDVGHSPRGYYVGKSIVADLMIEAVKETTKYYKLNVELAADFCFGKNWEQCH